VSAEASGWAWKNSPYSGTGMVLHLAVADVVNDAHGNEFWMTQTNLAKKARCTRQTANEWLGQAVDDGLLEVVEDNRTAGKPSKFRLLMPVEGGVGKSDTLEGGGVGKPDRGVSANPTPGVGKSDTELKENSIGTQVLSSDPDGSPVSSPPAEPTRRSKESNEKNWRGYSEDVDRLVELLARLVDQNGYKVIKLNDPKKASVGATWRQEIRLLIEADDYTPAQVEAVIRWACSDAFWSKNVRSAAKLREQFNRLRIERNEDIERRKADEHRHDHERRSEAHAGAGWMARSTGDGS